MYRAFSRVPRENLKYSVSADRFDRTTVKNEREQNGELPGGFSSLSGQGVDFHCSPR